MKATPECYCVPASANKPHRLRGLCANRPRGSRDRDTCGTMGAGSAGRKVRYAGQLQLFSIQSKRVGPPPRRPPTCTFRRRALSPHLASVQETLLLPVCLLFSLRYRAPPFTLLALSHCLARRARLCPSCIRAVVQSGLVFPHPGLSSIQPLSYSHSLPAQLLC